MSATAIQSSLVALAAELLVLEPEEITREYPLADLDSLDVVSLLFEIENELGMEFDEAKAKAFDTFGDVLDYCEAYAP